MPYWFEKHTPAEWARIQREERERRRSAARRAEERRAAKWQRIKNDFARARR